MTEPFRPSNATQADAFRADFCERCMHERHGITRCQIALNAMVYQIGDDSYPKEWIVNDDGSAECNCGSSQCGIGAPCRRDAGGLCDDIPNSDSEFIRQQFGRAESGTATTITSDDGETAAWRPTESELSGVADGLADRHDLTVCEMNIQYIIWEALNGDFKHWPQASTADLSGNRMQCVWYSRKENESASSRQESDEQQPVERPNSVHIVPCEYPSENGGQATCPHCNVCRMRKDVSAEAIKARQDLLKRMPSVDGKEKRSQAVEQQDDKQGVCVLRRAIQDQAGEGHDLLAFLWEQARMGATWFDREPPMIPRVATDIRERVSRLRAIGNGQVPLCAAVAWRVLTRRAMDVINI